MPINFVWTLPAGVDMADIIDDKAGAILNRCYLIVCT
jgi:hypothetical protein